MKQNLTYDLRTKHVIASFGKLPKNTAWIEHKLVSDPRYNLIDKLRNEYSEEYYE